MSAKHKRPFYVFAAVAAVCCMVLVTGLRTSKAANTVREPATYSSAAAPDELVVDDAGEPIRPRAAARLAIAVDARVRAAALAITEGGSENESDSLPDDSGTSDDPSGSEEVPDPGTGDIEGEQPPGTPETDGPEGDDDGDLTPVRPHSDEDQADDPPEQEADSEDDTDTDEEDPDEEEPVGPLDDPTGTEDPSGEGDGMGTDEAPDDGQGEPQN